MARNGLNDMLRYLRQLCQADAARDLSDRDLLSRFLSSQDENAFTILVQRHAAMVLNVCRRMLRDSHTAEDAFQATFLVLVRKAGSIRTRESLASWLQGVAQRIASRVRAQGDQQRIRERQAAEMPRAELMDELTWQELRAVLDAEIGSLPERYRAPIVLCHLEGKSHEKAAQELGWPRRTLSNRLMRARELLRRRLARRGFNMSGAVLAGAITEKVAEATAPAILTLSTVKGAMLFAIGKSATVGVISSGVMALAEGSMTAVIGFKGKVLAVLLATCVAAAGVGIAARQTPVEKPVPAPRKDASSPSKSFVAASIADVEKAWSRRQQELGKAKLSWTVRKLIPKETVLRRAELFRRERRREGQPDEVKAPAHDQRLSSSFKLLLNGADFRLTTESQVIDSKNGGNKPHKTDMMTKAGNGKVIMEGDFEYPVANITNDPPGAIPQILDCRPPFLIYRPLLTGLVRFENFVISPGVRSIDGRECVVLEKKRGGVPNSELWLDASRNFLLVRETWKEDGGVVYECDFQYSERPPHGWVLAGWKMKSSNTVGGLIDSADGTVTESQINPEFQPQAFDIEFPPGTWVRDFTKPGSHQWIVLPGGRKRLVTPRDKGASYKQLLTGERGQPDR